MVCPFHPILLLYPCHVSTSKFHPCVLSCIRWSNYWYCPGDDYLFEPGHFHNHRDEFCPPPQKPVKSPFSSFIATVDTRIGNVVPSFLIAKYSELSVLPPRIKPGIFSFARLKSSSVRISDE